MQLLEEDRVLPAGIIVARVEAEAGRPENRSVENGIAGKHGILQSCRSCSRADAAIGRTDSGALPFGHSLPIDEPIAHRSVCSLRKLGSTLISERGNRCYRDADGACVDIWAACHWPLRSVGAGGCCPAIRPQPRQGLPDHSHVQLCPRGHLSRLPVVLQLPRMPLHGLAVPSGCWPPGLPGAALHLGLKPLAHSYRRSDGRCPKHG